jgi:tripartite ATP-independent transporter DctM subunit
MLAAEAGLLLLVIFFVLLFLSVPVSVSIVLSALAAISFILTPKFGVFISAQNLVAGMDSFTLLAVPFFLLSGVIMSKSCIARRLVNLALVLVGRMPASLAVTNIMGNTMFAAVSGSSVASAAAIGGVMHPLEKENRYNENFSAAVNIASAPVGQLIPPTASFIVYSLASGGTSVAALFMAGWIPGFLWALACCLVVFFYAGRFTVPVKSEKISGPIFLKALLDALPSLLLIVVIIGGITAGIFTPTEAAGVSVLYTFILSVFIYKSLPLKRMPALLVETVMMTSVIMLIVGASSVLSFFLSFASIPAAISGFMLNISDNVYVLLFIINIFLLLIGIFMDMAPAILIFTPIFLPMMESLGVHPVHFGVIMVMNLAMGTITPPVGSVLFVGCSIANLEIHRVIRRLMPFYLALIGALLLVTYFPAFSLTLPRLFNML